MTASLLVCFILSSNCCPRFFSRVLVQGTHRKLPGIYLVHIDVEPFWSVYRHNKCTVDGCVICKVLVIFVFKPIIKHVTFYKQHKRSLLKHITLCAVFPPPATVNASTHQNHCNKKNSVWRFLPTGKVTGCRHQTFLKLGKHVFKKMSPKEIHHEVKWSEMSFLRGWIESNVSTCSVDVVIINYSVVLQDTEYTTNSSMPRF